MSKLQNISCSEQPKHKYASIMIDAKDLQSELTITLIDNNNKDR